MEATRSRRMQGLLGLAALLAGLCLAPCPATAGVADPMAVALEIKAAIMQGDAQLFVKHLQGSTYFIDELYQKEELITLFNTKGSWLQLNLFAGQDSVNTYFTTAKDLHIVLMQFGDEDVISYQSSNYPPHLWPWCAIRPREDTWVFSDLFAHR